MKSHIIYTYFLTVLPLSWFTNEDGLAWPWCMCKAYSTSRKRQKCKGMWTAYQSVVFSWLSNCGVPSTQVMMIQYCSNVQHLSLPLTKLGSKQLRKTTHHIGCLKTLQLKVDDDSDIKLFFLTTSKVKELSVLWNLCNLCFQVWVKMAKFKILCGCTIYYCSP